MAPTLPALNLLLAKHSYGSLGSKFVRRSNLTVNYGVYFIPCSECALSYVGQTEKDSGVRSQQYRVTVRLGKWKNNLQWHSFEILYTINWNAAGLFYRSLGEFKRLTVEALLIVHVPNFNLILGSSSINNFSDKLILDSKPSILK